MKQILVWTASAVKPGTEGSFQFSMLQWNSLQFRFYRTWFTSVCSIFTSLSLTLVFAFSWSISLILFFICSWNWLVPFIPQIYLVLFHLFSFPKSLFPAPALLLLSTSTKSFPKIPKWSRCHLLDNVLFQSFHWGSQRFVRVLMRFLFIDLY